MRNDYAYTSMMQFENAVNGYLSANWQIFQNGKAELIHDKELQYRGVDISCSNGLLIDTKIKNTQTIGQVFGYPSVEITIKHNTLSGWFTNPKVMTQAYLFVSVFSGKSRYQDIQASDITKLNCMLFFKKELKEYIEQFASMDRICHDALCLDDFNERQDYYDADGHKVFHLKYSPYNEGAVNLVLKRDAYLKLAHTKEFNL